MSARLTRFTLVKSCTEWSSSSSIADSGTEFALMFLSSSVKESALPVSGWRWAIGNEAPRTQYPRDSTPIVNASIIPLRAEMKRISRQLDHLVKFTGCSPGNDDVKFALQATVNSKCVIGLSNVMASPRTAGFTVSLSSIHFISHTSRLDRSSR